MAEIVIGKGNIGCTTTNCWEPKNFDRMESCSLSRNSVGYRVHMPNDYSTDWMVIFRDTKEGMHIDKMLAARYSDKRVNDYLIKLFLKKVSPDFIASLLKQMFNNGVSEGRKQKVNEIKSVLNIEEY
jgi:hypothetical protein